MTISIDDRQLVESYQAGDSHAFAELVHAHGSSLLGHAIRRLNDRAAAEDAVQETFVRAYRALPRFDGDYRLGPWLHRILDNVCADEGNRRRREADKFDRFAADPFAAEPAPGVEDELGLDIDDSDLESALASLPPSYREVLSLRFVQDLSYDEVAKVAGVSEENARARVSRARNAARTALRGVAAIPVFFVPALRRGERVAAAAQQATSNRSGAATMVTHAGPALTSATDAAMAAAPAATPLFTKAIIGLGLVAAVAAPNAGVDLVERSRAIGGVDAAQVADAPPVEAAPVPVTLAAPVVTTGPEIADPTTGLDDATRALGTAMLPELDPVDPVTLPAKPPSTAGPGDESDAPAVEPVIPVPAVRSGGSLTLSLLQMTPTAAGYDIFGDVTLEVDGRSYAGIAIGALTYEDDVDAGLRRLFAEFMVVVDGNRPVDVRLQLHAWPTADQAEVELESVATFDLVGQFWASSDDVVALLGDGTASGRFDASTNRFSLIFS